MIFRLGITESARKASDWNGEGSVQPSSRAASTHARLAATTSASGAVGEQAGNGERQLRAHLAVGDDDDPAAELDEPLDRALQVVVVHADDDDVVRVVRDRRRERAVAQPEAAHEPEADPAGAEVALDDGDLREVALGVGDDLPVAQRRLLDERLGHDLVGDDADHAHAPARRAAARSRSVDVGAARTVCLTHSGTAGRSISPTGRPRFSTSSGSKRSRSGSTSRSAW